MNSLRYEYLPAVTGGTWPGTFTFRRCVVQHLQYLISLASQPCSHWTGWGLYMSIMPEAVFMYPILFNEPYTLAPFYWGDALFRRTFLRHHPGSRFLVHIHCGGFNHASLAEFLLGAWDYLTILQVCLVLSSGKQRSFVFVRHTTVFFDAEGGSVEAWPSSGFFLEGHLETPRLLDWWSLLRDIFHREGPFTVPLYFFYIWEGDIGYIKHRYKKLILNILILFLIKFSRSDFSKFYTRHAHGPSGAVLDLI